MAAEVDDIILEWTDPPEPVDLLAGYADTIDLKAGIAADIELPDED